MLEKDVPELAVEEYREYLQDIVEVALQEHFGRHSKGYLRRFSGKLSTYPAKVNKDVVTHSSLAHQCGRFSVELQRCLEAVGLKTTISGAANVLPDHIYLVPENGPNDVIIDPTIGQAVVGHEHVFVGTRPQLRDLVLNQTGNEKPYALRAFNGINDAGTLFVVMWGTQSQPS